MSTTDGTSGRPGSGSQSPPAESSGSSGGSSPGPSDSATSDTRPMKAVGPGEPGGSATKTATPVPAQQKAPGSGQAAKTATAVPAAGGPGGPGGKDVAPATKAAAPAKKAAPGRPGVAGRRVRLTVSRVDPWSAMKMSFLLSVALGIAMVVMVFVLWSVLAGMGIFDRVNDIAQQVFGADGADAFDIMDYIGLGRVVSLSIVIGVIDVILFTAIATLGAFLYNVSAALVGGLQLTLTDD